MTWRTTSLKDLCDSSGGSIQTGPFGSQLHASDYVVDGVPVVMPQDIGANKILTRQIARIPDATAVRLTKYALEKGDIVFSRRGEVDKCALVRGEADGWLVGTGCLRVRTQDREIIDSRFLSYLLWSPHNRAWLKSHAVGATMPNLNTSILGRLPVSVPGIRVQRAIAEVLGALDDKIAANTQISLTAGDLLCARFELSGICDFQSGATLGRISDIIDLNPSNPAVVGESPVYLDMQNLPSSSMVAFSWDRRPAKGGARFQNGDTLLARITPCLENRKTGFVDFLRDGEVATGSTEFVVMRTRAGHHASLSYFLATNEDFRAFAIQQMIGTSGRQRVSARDLVGYPVASNADLAAFDGLADRLVPVLGSLRDESNQLAALRDTLLPELMSGRLRVKDAERQVEGVL